MEPSSSTSSSKKLLAGWLALAMLLVVLPWGVYLIAGTSLSEVGASRLGAKLEQSSNGLIADAPVFLRNCLREVVLLSTMLFGLIVGGAVFERVVRHRVRPLFLWIPLSVYVFIAANLLLLAAEDTAVFWVGMIPLGGGNKQAVFHTNRTVLGESSAPNRCVVIGSSQGGTEISAGELSRELRPETEFCNLSYAGSGAFDFLLLQNQYLPLRPRLVVVYTSEMTFHNELGTGRFLPFLNPQNALVLSELGWTGAKSGPVWTGLGAYLLPSFRIRRAVELSVFGSESGEFRARMKSGPKRSIEEVAVEWGRGYRIDGDTEILKRAFQRFLEINAREGITTVLILGQVSPLLEEEISPEVKSDYRKFLLAQANAKSPAVIVL
ncbi:MAG: hypothetical protein NT013_13565, partial [Planctomycetia bacterium]|nr:hypothetical protein [Planctomycetia bacterium]